MGSRFGGLKQAEPVTEDGKGIAEESRTHQPHGNTFLYLLPCKTYKVILCCVFAQQNLLKNYLPRGASQLWQSKKVL